MTSCSDTGTSSPSASSSGAISFDITGTLAGPHFLVIKVKSDAEIPRAGLILSANSTPPPGDIVTNLSFHAVAFTNRLEKIFLLGTTDKFSRVGAAQVFNDKAAAINYGALVSDSEYWVHFYVSNSVTGSYDSVQSEKLATADYTMISNASAVNPFPEVNAITNFIGTAPITYQTGKLLFISMTMHSSVTGPVEIRHSGIYQGQCVIPGNLVSCTTGIVTYPLQDGNRPTYLMGVAGMPTTLSIIQSVGNIHINLRGYE